MPVIKLIRKRFRDCLMLPEGYSRCYLIGAHAELELTLWRCIETYNRTKKKVGNCSKAKFEEDGLLLCCVIEGDLL